MSISKTSIFPIVTIAQTHFIIKYKSRHVNIMFNSLYVYQTYEIGKAERLNKQYNRTPLYEGTESHRIINTCAKEKGLDTIGPSKSK